MKHDTQVFEITSPAKEIIMPHGCSEACEHCEQALVAVSGWRLHRADLDPLKAGRRKKIVWPVLFQILSIIKTNGQNYN